METYIYNADLLCGDCGHDVRRNIEATAMDSFRERNPDAILDSSDPEDVDIALGFDPENESDYDSEQYPKGPFPAGESDSPDHCGKCGVFLENPLTGDGYEYVIDAFISFLVYRDGDAETIRQWLAFYADSLDMADVGDAALEVLRTRIEFAIAENN